MSGPLLQDGLNADTLTGVAQVVEDNVPPPFDPGEHSVEELKGYLASINELVGLEALSVEDALGEVDRVRAAEVEGKDRATALAALDEVTAAYTPFDPAEHTIPQVHDHLAKFEGTELLAELGAVTQAEAAGKARSTLLSSLTEQTQAVQASLAEQGETENASEEPTGDEEAADVEDTASDTEGDESTAPDADETTEGETSGTTDEPAGAGAEDETKET